MQPPSRSAEIGLPPPGAAAEGAVPAPTERVAGDEVAALAFALSLLVFLLVPGLLVGAVPFYPLLRWGDLLDLLTPLVVVPAAWLLVARAGSRPLGAVETVAFLLLAALWVEGHSLHLAANAIHHLTTDGPAAELATFVDEVLSHYVWHVALVGLTALVAVRSVRAAPAAPAGPSSASSRATLVTAAAVYGFTFFVVVVESATAPFAVPAAIALGVATLLAGRGRLTASPGAAFVLAGYAVGLALIGGWAALHGGRLPEFSELGLID